MGWFLRVKKGMSWKEQAIASFGAPPPQLMAFTAVLLMLVYLATHSDYKERMEKRKTGFRFSLLLLPLLLIVVLNLVMLRHRLLRYNFGAHHHHYHHAAADDDAGSASGLVLVLLLLFVLVHYQSSFHSSWFRFI
ncbi:uncharacterized protein LOC121802481 [Salvia splendens]|uniref:uncharacterized protein LOC121802481 n=1 Tax=Salvia splendens TaxID=180675 RepID=UPI001C27CA1F|nr:uncharacterized protein LOC121802481 [Salvia splendens]